MLSCPRGFQALRSCSSPSRSTSWTPCAWRRCLASFAKSSTSSSPGRDFVTVAAPAGWPCAREGVAKHRARVVKRQQSQPTPKRMGAASRNREDVARGTSPQGRRLSSGLGRNCQRSSQGGPRQQSQRSSNQHHARRTHLASASAIVSCFRPCRLLEIQQEERRGLIDPSTSSRRRPTLVWPPFTGG